MSSVCRICLAGNTGLHSVKNNLLRHFYKKLSDTEFNYGDARPRALCCFCYQKLLRFHTFSQMAHRSEKIFSDLYDKGLEATPESVTEGNLGVQQHLSLVTLQFITIDGNATDSGSQVTIKEEPLPSIDIKEEETTEPDKLVESESFPQYCTKSELTLQGDNSDRGNDDRLLYNIHVVQTKPDDSKKFAIKDEQHSIDIKEEVTTEPGKLVEVEYLPQDCIKSELPIGDNSERGNDVDINLFNINVEQTKPDDSKMPYICNNCNKIFYIKDKFISHIRNSHSQNSENKQHTDATSKIEDKIIHNEKKLFACDLCDKKFGYKSSLVYHLGTHTRAKPALPCRVACRVCAKQFSENSILVSHMKIHLGEKPFDCNLCGKQFHRKFSLICHMRTHTGEKPFLCNVCDKQFIRKDLLHLHMRNHTGEKAYACHLCDKKFNQKSNFDGHMITHTGEKPFVCQVCDKRFHAKGHLVEHNKTHSAEKPFACSVCDKQFYRNCNLVSHMRTHSNEKPFACHVCDKRFKRKDQLVEHIRCHTGEKPYVCHVCDKKFAYKTSHVKHVRIHTRDLS